MSIKFYSVSDAYIKFLSRVDAKVLSNHEEGRKHMRPYVGFVLRINDCDYFLPLSSKDPSDFDKDGTLKKSTITIIRMINNRGDFVGKILLNNMIPASDDVVKPILLKQEIIMNNTTEEEVARIKANNLYIDLLIDEKNWIEKHLKEIRKKAIIVYNSKTNEDNQSYWKGKQKPGYLKATVDFKLLEKALETFEDKLQKEK